MEALTSILSFDGEYRFLSNFYRCQISYGGYEFGCLESAYQAAKCQLAYQMEEFTAMTPGEAKRKGRSVLLRPDWEQVKDTIMYRLLKEKFSLPSLRTKLLLTGDAYLMEGNNWGDTYWGCVFDDDINQWVGENRLGELLMKVRNEIKCLKNSSQSQSSCVFA